MTEFFNYIISNFLSLVMSVLPKSPFTQYINVFKGLPQLGVLNWFFPISDMITIGTVWLSAISIFYIYSLIMRWLKLLGD